MSVRGLYSNHGPQAVSAIALDAHFHIDGKPEPTVPFQVWSTNSSPVRFFLPAASDGSLHLTVSHARNDAAPGLGRRVLDAIVLGRPCADTDSQSGRQEHSCQIGLDHPRSLGALRAGTYFIAIGQASNSAPEWDRLTYAAIGDSPSAERLVERTEGGDREASFPYFVLTVHPA